MRMTGDHLVRDGCYHVAKIEKTPLLGHLRMKDGLKEQIAQFSLQLSPGLPFDRISNLVGFFYRVGSDGGEVLLQIPGTARFRVTQPPHDLQQSRHAPFRVCHQPVARITVHPDPPVTLMHRA